MTALRTKWSAYLDQQHRNPNGPIGYLIGERMRHQHTPETEWSVDLLQLKPSDRVLEIGFGAGRGLALSLQRISQGRVTGIDRSSTMIHAARRRNRTALVCGRLTLLKGDLAHLPFRYQQFNKIFSIHTFYFWPDAEAICQQLINLLDQGGRLVSTFATAQTDTDGSRVYWPIHQHAKELLCKLQQAGIDAQLLAGPDSRQYNNVAIIIDKY